jgi:hypothetical protein
MKIIALSVAVFAGSLCSSAYAQIPTIAKARDHQPPSTSETSSRVRRAAAVVAAVRSGSGEPLLRNPQFQAEWLALLRDENTTHVSRLTDPDFANQLGEAWSEYYAEVLEVSVEIVERVAIDAKREWLHELVRGSYNADSAFAIWLAGYGDPVADESLRLVDSAPAAALRVNAYALLTHLLSRSAYRPHAQQRPYAGELSFGTRQKAIQAVSAGLKGSDEVVAREIVGALVKDPSAESVALLKDALLTGRGRPGFTSRGTFQRSLQEEIEKAIADGEKALAVPR